MYMYIHPKTLQHMLIEVNIKDRHVFENVLQKHKYIYIF